MEMEANGEEMERVAAAGGGGWRMATAAKGGRCEMGRMEVLRGGIRACVRGMKVGCKWVMGSGRVGLRARWEAWDDDGGWAQGRIVLERRCVRWVLMEGFGCKDGDGDGRMGVDGDDWA
ncbi:hypothetical protein MRB53_023442 [Persea americana]|uniref:Uncharacterized protein n=1 Tax=Persea americana TaxID=3435 RepID=A0ACC2LAP8_PERAE|nr:hypothetical protein MRB53_023442 [Persea americana]